MVVRSKYLDLTEVVSTPQMNFEIIVGKIGIKQQFTTAYTPQQNGIAERKNRTILDMTRIMLKEKCLPKNFWVEAVACIAYLLN